MDHHTRGQLLLDVSLNHILAAASQPIAPDVDNPQIRIQPTQSAKWVKHA
jgi:hypothetical protein